MSTTFKVGAELDIYSAGRTGAQIHAALSALAPGQALAIDLAEVAEIDAAGLQLLVAAALSESRGGPRVYFEATPGSVRGKFTQLGIDHLLCGAAS